MISTALINAYIFTCTNSFGGEGIVEVEGGLVFVQLTGGRVVSGRILVV